MDEAYKIGVELSEGDNVDEAHKVGVEPSEGDNVDEGHTVGEPREERGIVDEAQNLPSLDERVNADEAHKVEGGDTDLQFKILERLDNFDWTMAY